MIRSRAELVAALHRGEVVSLLSDEDGAPLWSVAGETVRRTAVEAAQRHGGLEAVQTSLFGEPMQYALRLGASTEAQSRRHIA